jgi:putative membrane protein
MPIGAWELAILSIILGGPLLLGVLFAIYMFTRSRSDSQSKSGNQSAFEILDQRYARGEIDDEEYRQRRQNLSDSRSHNP